MYKKATRNTKKKKFFFFFRKKTFKKSRSKYEETKRWHKFKQPMKSEKKESI